MTSRIITLVIPVYNDLPALKKAIPATIQLMESKYPEFELIIAEDASTDGSTEYAALAAREDPRIIHLHRDKRGGRGSALTESVRKANGEIFCYFDVDLATDMNHLIELIEAIDQEYEIAIGSRLMKDSEITRSLNREIKSRGYNLLVQTLLGSRVNDHQCGFKAFNRRKLIDILDEVTDTHWFWDTEVLVRAQRRGYRIAEIPVLWREGAGTTVRREDIWKMGRSILGLWWKIHVS
ncbi:MAG TPA: dolichyl-phosphate beta-glucosyltransferase [Methanospirillum sp.]|nr:dolichyl-phosphate beta-glucosyltransferase [Methanospirillum sp.]